jgi:hypothetical protein
MKEKGRMRMRERRRRDEEETRRDETRRDKTRRDARGGGGGWKWNKRLNEERGESTTVVVESERESNG